MTDGQRKLAHLRHGHPDLHRGARASSRQYRSDGVGHDLAAHEHSHHHQGRHDVVVQGSVVDEHAYRQEEQCAEHVAHRVYQARHPSGGVGVTDDHADQEGAGRRRQSEKLGPQRQAETAAQ